MSLTNSDGCYPSHDSESDLLLPRPVRGGRRCGSKPGLRRWPAVQVYRHVDRAAAASAAAPVPSDRDRQGHRDSGWP